MGSALLGLDVGTSSLKALLLSEEGEVLAVASEPYAVHNPRPLWSEQDPEQWWIACRRATARVREAVGTRHEVVAVGLTGQMHGAVLLDEGGRVLRPCILWNDQRTAAECEEITARVGDERVLDLTGNPVLTGFTAPKLLWVGRHEPEIHARVRHLLLPKDYLRLRLTGDHAGDVSDASGTALFDVAERRWSDEMLEAAEVQRHWLPEVGESPELTTRVSDSAAAELGIRAGTPVAAGAGDQAAGAVGMGIVEPGSASTTLGTSGVVFAATDTLRRVSGGRLHAFCHAVPGTWHLMGVILSAAGSLEWFRQALGEEESRRAEAEGRNAHEFLLEEAGRAPAGCEGLHFLPYLTGERTPHVDPYARGAFIGLTLRHRKAHLIRAVLEGVAFGLRDALELVRQAGIRPREMRVSGGGARSREWRGILADVFALPLVQIQPAEGAALGAAMIAGVGSGVFEGFGEASAKCLRTGEALSPGEDVALYEESYQEFRRLYPALRDLFPRA